MCIYCILDWTLYDIFNICFLSLSVLKVITAYVIDNLLYTRHEMCEEVPGLSIRFHDTV